MKRVVFLIFAVSLLTTTVFKGQSVMTMTTSSDKVQIFLAGSGTFAIDWGDGSEIMSYTLGEYKARWFRIRNEYSYNYDSETSRTITIIGENITHVDCFNNKATSLDVSRNPVLIYLDCRFNQLTSLDVSKNTKLSKLIVQGNQLTSLDISNNIAIAGLSCGNNMIKNLDVSNNKALTRLCYTSNPNMYPMFPFASNEEASAYADAVNNLFMSLNSNSGKKIIQISGLSDKEVSYDKSIAKKKGWKIVEIKVKETTKNGVKSKNIFVPDIV